MSYRVFTNSKNFLRVEKRKKARGEKRMSSPRALALTWAQFDDWIAGEAQAIPNCAHTEMMSFIERLFS